jgi:hypothetical protein
MKKLLLGFLYLGAAMMATTFATTTAKADCTVTFADYFGLGNMYPGWGRTMFGAWSEWDAQHGRPMACRNLSEDAWQTSGCWSYRQRCGTMQNGQAAYFNAWPQGNEMHPVFLESQQIGYNSCMCDPQDGMGPGFQYKLSTGC